MVNISMSDQTEVFRRMCAVCVLVLMVAAGVAAQSSVSGSSTTSAMTPTGMSPGSPAGTYALSGFDNVNLFNGNLNFRLPLMTIGGRGSSGYTMMLATSTKRWQVRTDPGQDTNGGGGPITDKFTPQWNQWNTLEVGYSPGVMQGRKTGVGTVVTKTCDTCPIICNRRDPLYRYTLTRLTFIAPDGTEYELRDDLTHGEPKPVPEARCNDLETVGEPRGKYFVSADGSAMTFKADADINDNVLVPKGSLGAWFFNPSGMLYMRDGTTYRIDFGRVSWIRDRNGNQVTFVYGTTTEITDSLGRKVTIEYDLTEAPYGKHDRITYHGFGGAQRVLHVSKGPLSSALRSPYTPKSRAQLFPQLNGALGFSGNFDPEVVTAVWLPDGRKYSIFYNSYAEVARVELPTGGATEYDMKDGSGVIVSSGATASGVQEAQIYRRLKESRIYTGLAADTLVSRTIYTAGDGVNEYNGTTIFDDHVVKVEQRDGANNLLALSKHYFDSSAANSLFTREVGALYSSGGREISTESLDTVNTNAILRTVTNTWEPRAPVSWVGNLQTWGHNFPPPGLSRTPENDPRLTRVVTRLETSDVTQQEFSYDDYNNQTEVRDYGYGQDQPGDLLRRTVTDYLTTNPINGADYVAKEGSIHLRSLPVNKSIYAGISTTPVAKTSYEYDNYTPDPSNGNRHSGLVSRPAIFGLCAFYDGRQCFDPDDLGHPPNSYATRGNLTGTTQYLLGADGTVIGSVTTNQQYDVAGNVVRIIDPRSTPQTVFATTIEYDDHFGIPDGQVQANSTPAELAQQGKQSYALPTTLTNPLGQTVRCEYDYYTGHPVDGQDANNVVASGYYENALDRPTKLIEAVNANERRQTTFSYDDANRVITTKSDLNSFQDTAPLMSQIIYDGLGRTTETRQYESATDFIATLTQYDGLGRASAVSNPYRPLAQPSPTPVWTTTEYDALGRVQKIATADGAKVYTLYDGARTLVTDQAGKQRISRTDAIGNLTDVWEIVSSASTDSESDAVSFPIPQGVPVTAVAKGYKTSYQYDALNNLRQVTQGQQHRYFAYDSLSRLIRMKNPEQDETSAIFFPSFTDPVTQNSSWSAAYAYDEAGNLKQSLDRVLTTYVYDALGRVTTRAYSDGTPGVNYFYDLQTPPGVPAGFVNGSSVGRLVAVTYGDATSTTGTYTGGYDAFGRPQLSWQRTDTGTNGGLKTYQLGYSYDLAGHLKTEKYPSGRVVETVYDGAGRVAGVKNQTDGRYYVGAPSTDLEGRLRYAAHGAVDRMRLGNGLWEHTNFNSRLQPTQIGLGSASTNSSILQLDYAYGSSDNNGNVQSQKITVPTVGVVTGFTATQTYTYDSLNRLATAQENNGSWQQNFDYDRYGNRKFMLGTTLPATLTAANNPAVNPSNNRINDKVAGQENILYDNAGNLTRDVGGHTYQYDAENKMVRFDGGPTAAGGASYSYDGDGRRVKKVVGVSMSTTIFVYDINGQLIAEYSDSGATGAGTSYVTSDTLGSSRVITGAASQVVGRHDYLPFGEDLLAGTSGRQPQQNFGAGNLRQEFTGQERDIETNLDYFKARYYASAQGRFMSPDPLLASGRAGSPKTWNRYAYVLNNPLRLVDPNGLQQKETTKKTQSNLGGDIGPGQGIFRKAKESTLAADIGPGQGIFRKAKESTHAGDVGPGKVVHKNFAEDLGVGEGILRKTESARVAEDMGVGAGILRRANPDIVGGAVIILGPPEMLDDYEYCFHDEMRPAMDKGYRMMEKDLYKTIAGVIVDPPKGSLVPLVEWSFDIRDWNVDVLTPAREAAQDKCLKAAVKRH